MLQKTQQPYAILSIRYRCIERYNLDILLTHLDNQTAYLISQVDQRYVEMQEDDKAMVTEIIVDNAP